MVKAKHRQGIKPIGPFGEQLFRSFRLIYHLRMLKQIPVLAICVLCLAPKSFAQCPDIKLSGPEGLTFPGVNLGFQVEVSPAGPKLEYLWSLDEGIIISGQGTPMITVVAPRHLSGQLITATVQVGGLPSGCERSASVKAGIDHIPSWHWLESFERSKPNEIRGRLDVLFVELINNPKEVGFIQLRVTRGEKFDSNNKRIKFILRHAEFRKFDPRRLWFGLKRADAPMTNWTRILPKGENDLPCDRCLIIKGGHL